MDETRAAMDGAVEHPRGLVGMAVWACSAMQLLAMPAVDLAVAAAIEVLAASSALAVVLC